MSSDFQPSDEALKGLFAEARKAAGDEPVPETPEWLADGSFPVELRRYVAHGGAGFVWQGVLRRDGASVALKWVPFRGRRAALRWRAECEALERLNHPNLVRCLDHGLAPDGESGWIAMEWIEGASLEQRLEKVGPLDLKAARALVAQVSAGLAALHGEGLIHRDIKPSNLLRESSGGRWVVADFGVVHDLRVEPDLRLTHTRERPETPGYAPPESQEAGMAPDARWDQYGLAVTVWEALTGKLPVGAFPRLQKLCRAPAALDRMLRRAMSSDRERRFPDVVHFARAFARAARCPRWLGWLWRGLFPLMIWLVLWLVFRPPPFPREFHSGPLRVTEGREHFMEIDLTLEEDGKFLAVMRTWSGDALFGFTGKARLIWRDGDGNVLKVQDSNPVGVNGRLIVGAPSERLDHWRDRLPPEMAARVEQVDFRATPGGISQEEREDANRRRLEKDLRQIREGTGRALDSVLRTLRERDEEQ